MNKRAYTVSSGDLRTTVMAEGRGDALRRFFRAVLDAGREADAGRVVVVHDGDDRTEAPTAPILFAAGRLGWEEAVPQVTALTGRTAAEARELLLACRSSDVWADYRPEPSAGPRGPRCAVCGEPVDPHHGAVRKGWATVGSSPLRRVSYRHRSCT